MSEHGKGQKRALRNVGTAGVCVSELGPFYLVLEDLNTFPSKNLPYEVMLPKLCPKITDWILGRISFLKEWPGIGPGCPGRWWSPHPWRSPKDV